MTTGSGYGFRASFVTGFIQNNNYVGRPADVLGSIDLKVPSGLSFTTTRSPPILVVRFPPCRAMMIWLR
jgi:hypothetical protein